jgi:hypothetical protein|tara:strand:+ start:44 stop:739 length:696 start_codon:yes stop_codon:yes gene_type:complete
MKLNKMVDTEDDVYDFNSLIEEYLDKRIEYRKLSAELIQLRKNIYYLRKQQGNNKSEEFVLEKGKVILKNYVSKYSSLLKKDFKKLSNEEKRELYKTGLISLRFRLNYLKYQKLKDANKKTPLDNYTIERESQQPFYVNIELNKKSQNELEDFKTDLTNLSDIETMEIEEESIIDEVMAEYEESDIDSYNEIMENVELHPSFFTDDAPYDLEDTPENREKGIYVDSEEVEE